MAKKAVASLQKGAGKGHAKVIKMVKSPKTGAYTRHLDWQFVFEQNFIHEHGCQRMLCGGNHV